MTKKYNILRPELDALLKKWIPEAGNPEDILILSEWSSFQKLLRVKDLSKASPGKKEEIKRKAANLIWRLQKRLNIKTI